MTDETKDDQKPDLTAKQRAFVLEYLVDLNGTQAAIRAGYSPDSARSIAHENLTKPDIAQAIDAAMAERAGVTRTKVLDELARIAFSNAGDFFRWGPDGVELIDSTELTPEQRAIVSEIVETKSEKGGSVRLKLSDKQSALEKLGRVLGMFKERVEHTGANGGPIETADVSETDVARRIAFTLAKGIQQKPTEH